MGIHEWKRPRVYQYLQRAKMPEAARVLATMRQSGRVPEFASDPAATPEAAGEAAAIPVDVVIEAFHIFARQQMIGPSINSFN